MKDMDMKRAWIVALVATALIWTSTAHAYVEAPYALGRIILESTNIVLMRCEKVDTERNLIIYKKVRDIKGVHPTELIKHNIGHAGFNPRESQFCMASVAVGKDALFFHNGSAGECCVENYWYQVYPGGDWWNMQHGEPYLLRSFAGKPDKLADFVAQIIAGKEVIVPCMVDGDKNALQLRQAKIQRMKASMKIQDYDPRRDFAGWGNDEFRRIAGLPGFAMYGAITRTDPGAWGIAPANLAGDGMKDLCVYGEDKVALLSSSGNAMEEASLPYGAGARSACWGDFNGDGKPDLLLATPTGPKLFTNTGSGFRDDSVLLPKEAYYNLSSAQFIDFDGDGKPDILLANGFLGLRLYRNKGNVAPVNAATPNAPKLSKWHICGPFDNANGTAGFDTVYPPEKEINLQATYTGKANQKVAWKEAAFADNQINDIAALFPKAEDKENAVAYLYRELDYGTAVELPVSFGSDDTLTVWLNGEKLISANVQRNCEPDQHLVTLKLKPGKNQLLLKVGQGSGQWSYYYNTKGAPSVTVPTQFEDISDSVGLGLHGIGSDVKGDRLLVADLNGDGKADFLYCAGSGVVALNNGKGFAELKGSGINGVSFQDGRLAPAFGDFNGDKAMDLVVPQANGVKLFRNDGTGHFIDVTAQSGDLAKFTGPANCAIFSDFSNKGRQDILVGCSKSPNRYFRSNGNGTFTDATDAIGLSQKVFNTRFLAVFDMNKDGIPDLAMNNEGQESAVLVGAAGRVGKK
jgi:hypothetical protein